MKHLITLVIICLSFYANAVEQDSIKIDVSNQLFFFQEGERKILIDDTQVQKSIHLELNHNEYGNGVIKIDLPKNTTILINNKVYQITADDLVVSIEYYNDLGIISLYNKEGLSNVKVALLVKGNYAGNELDIVVREKGIFANFLMIASLLVLTLYVYNKKRSSELFSNHFKIVRALTIKTINETLFKIRVLEKSNLMLLIAHAFGMSLVTMSLFYWGQMESKIGQWFIFNTVGSALLMWMILGVGVFAALMIKSALIAGFTSIFKLKSFARIHFYTYLRITLLTYILLFLIILIFSYQFPNVEALPFTLNFALTLMLTRIIITFIKLMNVQSLRKVYLFSYLCATEILPFIFLMKITYL